YGNVATATSPQTVSLTTTSTAPFGVHFRDTTDSSNIGSVTIGSGASSASFRYNDTLAGSPSLTASDGALTSPSTAQTETVKATRPSQLAFPTPVQPLTAGHPPALLTVHPPDPYGNVATATSPQTVLLTMTSTAPFGVHFRDSSDTTNITGVTIGSGAN